MVEHEVVIAGGGPTGLMLAGELALAGVDVVIVEPRPDQQVDGSRAGGLYARTLEVLDQRGIADRFVAAGQQHQALAFSQMFLDISDFPTRFNYVLALWQSRIEPLLAEWVAELGVPTLRGRSVTGFMQNEAGVDAAVSDGTTIRAQYVVGCDGGRSVVRKSAGIDFVGQEPTTSWMIAEVEMDSDPEFGFRNDALGTHAIGRREPGEPIRLVLTEREVAHDADPTMNDLREALIGVYGTDFGLRHATWISRFSDMTRQAEVYRKGRVMLAGDAAHVHPPHGGQGLNTGVQDAVNLGWKLAQVIRGVSPDALLDTYHAERHPVGERVLQNTMAQVLMARPDDRHQALRRTMTELLVMDEPRKHIVGMLSGLDIRYDLGDGHPLLGHRMPDLDLKTADGTTRVFALLHEARPVLLDLGGVGSFDVTPWADRLRFVEATYDGVWELPVLGEVAAPAAVLIRPDGYVAWAGVLADPALRHALTTWCGSP